MPHKFCDWSVQLTMLCCDMVLPHHFPSHCCWILHVSLVSVSQYPSLLIVMPVESQSTQNSMQVREIFGVVYVYAVSIALTDASFQVCYNVTKIPSL